MQNEAAKTALHGCTVREETMLDTTPATAVTQVLTDLNTALSKADPAAAAALLFGFSIVLRIWANQVSPGIPTDFITIVPYVVTLIAVVGFVGRVRAPAATGKPYIKG
jgi:hypothetical protein